MNKTNLENCTSLENSLASKDKDAMFGEEMIWLLILGDMCVFALFFFIYAHFRVENIALFREAQAGLSVSFGSINTLLLLASSWFVVVAAVLARKRLAKKASNMLVAAFVLGGLFAVLKSYEYQQKAALGISYETNDFYLFYYLLTGIHFAHLLVGLSLLAYFWYVFRFKGVTERHFSAFESGAIYWHMVDLLWIIIFPLLYLLP